MTSKQYWIWLKATNPGLHKLRSAESRLKHKVRRRIRAVNWNRVNADRRNVRRRIRYAERKAEI